MPIALIKDKMFKGISTDAKLLYGLLLNRTGLSIKNHWLDSENRTYITYTIENVMEDLGIGSTKAKKLFAELVDIISVYYNKKKRMSNRSKLKDTIRYALKNSNSYDEFLHLLKNEGIEIKTGTHLAMKIPTAKKFIRIERLGTEYSEDMLKLYFANRGEYVRLKNEADQTKIEHLAQNAEYNKYAAVHNINVQIRMMNVLSEMGIQGVDELKAKIEELEEQVDNDSRSIEIIADRIKSDRDYIGALRNYWRLKPIYTEYKAIKSDADKEIFMLDHRQDVEDYKRVVDTINSARANGMSKDTASIKADIEADEQKKAEISEHQEKRKEELQKCRLILENMKSMGLVEEEIEEDEYSYSSYRDNSR